MSFQTTNTFHRPVEINGHEIQATVTVSWDYDDLPPEGSFDFGNDRENTEHLARFRSGELFLAVVRVQARAEGLSGSDILGGCEVSTNDIDADVRATATDYDMAANALDDLKQTIQTQANRLFKYAQAGAA